MAASEPEISLTWLTLKEPMPEDFLEMTALNVSASQKEASNVRFELFVPRANHNPVVPRPPPAPPPSQLLGSWCCCSRVQPGRLEESRGWTCLVLEVYDSQAGAARHKELPHSKTWGDFLLQHLAEHGGDRRWYRAHGVEGGLEAFRGGDVKAGMDVTVVHCVCKPGTEADFVRATLKNQAGVRTHEPGHVRFDVLQELEDPRRFVLFEAFTSAAAVATHKTMEHFLEWRQEVQDYMAAPRRGEKIDIMAMKRCSL